MRCMSRTSGPGRTRWRQVFAYKLGRAPQMGQMAACWRIQECENWIWRREYSSSLKAFTQTGATYGAVHSVTTYLMRQIGLTWRFLKKFCKITCWDIMKGHEPGHSEIRSHNSDAIKISSDAKSFKVVATVKCSAHTGSNRTPHRKKAPPL